MTDRYCDLALDFTNDAAAGDATGTPATGPGGLQSMIEGWGNHDALTAGGQRSGGMLDAEKAGVNLNVELLNSKVDHAGYQCDRTSWGVAMCRKAASPRVKLLYDIYHMQIMEGDVIRTIRENIQWIGHFHTAGNPERRDLDDSQELNYRGICRAIAGTGFDGFVAHEFTPRGDPIEALREAFQTCDQQ